jgi:hypothetical protein
MNKSELVLAIFIGVILFMMYRLGLLEDIFDTF